MVIELHNKYAYITYTYSSEICDSSESGFGNITMCPICDNYCGYWKLSDSCFNSKIAYLFDNAATVIWSIFMTVWGKFIFLKYMVCKQKYVKIKFKKSQFII